jgi:putative transferase (TIGR04331 family)
MFLITTANQNFWKLDEPILFLGEWCRIYSQKHIWSKLSQEVLPYHGMNREALHKDYIYAANIFERLLIQLTDSLNELHGSNHSVRYWRIILGPWLSIFIQILLDRYRSVCVAADSGKVTNTWITTEFPEGYLPNDFSGFRNRTLRDDYNHCLYSQIIKSSGVIPWETKNNAVTLTFDSKEAPTSQKDSLKWVLIRLLSIFSRFIPETSQQLIAHQSYIKPMDLIRLQLSMKMFPRPFRPTVDTVPSKVDWKMRERIKLEQGENQFESVLRESIPLHMPKVYMEGYSSMVKRAVEAFPENPTVILTSNAYKRDEGFKFWAAGQVDRGAKLVITQHGGHVGDGLWSTDDDHEVNIADRYFSWGWTRENEKKVVPMPSSMLLKARDCTPDPKGEILCLPTSFPRYLYCMFSVPQGPLVLENFKLQEKFFQTVSSSVSNLLVLRLEPKNRPWDEKMRWSDSSFSPKIYQEDKSFHDHLLTSRLCVCFYNGTPFLETFVANYPTLLCWDPRSTETNELAKPYFDLLRKVGVLFDTPQAAASKLNGIYHDPLSWWMSPKVQDAKNKFCDRFARVSVDWKTEWQLELSKLIQEKK